MKTDRDIINLALAELGVTPIEQTPDAANYAYAERVFNGLLKELQARELIAWGADEHPDEVDLSFARLLAQRAAPRLAVDEVKQEMLLLGNKPMTDFIAVAGKKWGGNPTTSADPF